MLKLSRNPVKLSPPGTSSDSLGWRKRNRPGGTRAVLLVAFMVMLAIFPLGSRTAHADAYDNLPLNFVPVKIIVTPVPESAGLVAGGLAHVQATYANKGGIWTPADYQGSVDDAYRLEIPWGFEPVEDGQGHAFGDTIALTGGNGSVFFDNGGPSSSASECSFGFSTFVCSVGAMNSLASISLGFYVRLPTDPGKYALMSVVNPDYNMPTLMTSITQDVVVLPSPGKPDLTLAITGPTTALASSPNEYSAVVTNVGPGPASSGTPLTLQAIDEDGNPLAFTVETGWNGSCATLVAGTASCVLPNPIPAGQSVKVALAVKAPAIRLSGQGVWFTVRGTADVDNDVDEVNEQNNKAAYSSVTAEAVASYSPHPDDTGWVHDGATVTLQGAPTVGGFTYSINGGPGIRVDGNPVTFWVSDDGNNVITYTAHYLFGFADGPALTVPIDSAPPAPNCQQSDGKWHANNVTYACHPTDRSGIANAADANFTLTAALGSGEWDDVPSGVRYICDQEQHCILVHVDHTKIDKAAPQVTCGTPQAGWSTTDVSISCTASDGGSGLAHADDARFTVSTGTSTPNASIDPRQVCDAVGNCASTPAYTGLQVDKGGPTVHCGQGDSSWHRDNQTFSCTASDDTGPGLADLADAQFTLTTHVADGNADANASTNSRTVCDVLNVCATAQMTGLRIDRSPPTATCGTADGAWHAANVQIACGATDVGSGLVAGNDLVTLSTDVGPGSETRTASTGSKQVCDVAGNCVTAGPITGNMVDRLAPAITLTAPRNVTYFLNQSVAAEYACTDGGSGVDTCGGTVQPGAAIDTGSVGTRTFQVSSRDQVGNESTPATVQYSVTYKIDLLYDGSKAKPSNAAFPLKHQITDASGVNLSSASLPLTITGIAPAVAGFDPGAAFQFDPSVGHGGGYWLNLKPRGLPSGEYSLQFTIPGDPVVHAAPFAVK